MKGLMLELIEIKNISLILLAVYLIHKLDAHFYSLKEYQIGFQRL